MSLWQRGTSADQAANDVQVTGAASAAIAALEILFLGALWHWTQDLSTPMAAALLTYGVDFAGMYQKLATKQH